MEEFEERLVSYEIAVLARKLGFIARTLHGVEEGDKFTLGPGLYDWNSDRTVRPISAPTHGQLYRWIRKHHVYIDTETIISRGEVVFKFYVLHGDCLKCVDTLEENYHDYDKGFDDAILTALRIIFERHEHDHKDDCGCDDDHHHLKD